MFMTASEQVKASILRNWFTYYVDPLVNASLPQNEAEIKAHDMFFDGLDADSRDVIQDYYSKHVF